MKNFMLLLLLSATCLAQEAPCGLTSIKETTPLLYPHIARAAHIEGIVIFLVYSSAAGKSTMLKYSADQNCCKLQHRYM
jgi:hypothetical protein